MIFRDAIVAGVQLVRSAIQSENYVPGVSGWRIARDGLAEFLSVLIRGSFIAENPQGAIHINPDYIPGQAPGIVFYDAAQQQVAEFLVSTFLTLYGHQGTSSITLGHNVLTLAAGGMVPGQIDLNAGDGAFLNGRPLVAGTSGRTTDTTNATGYVTITHGLGATPSTVIAVGGDPDTGSNIPTGLIVDNIGATTFRVRCINQTGSQIASGSVTINWLAIA